MDPYSLNKETVNQTREQNVNQIQSFDFVKLKQILLKKKQLAYLQSSSHSPPQNTKKAIILQQLVQQ